MGAAKSKACARGARTGDVRHFRTLSVRAGARRATVAHGSRRGAALKTRKLRGSKGPAKGMALRAVFSRRFRAGLICAAPPALLGCLDLACALDFESAQSAARRIAINVLPRTFCELRKRMRYPESQNAVARRTSGVRHPSSFPQYVRFLPRSKRSNLELRSI